MRIQQRLIVCGVLVAGVVFSMGRQSHASSILISNSSANNILKYDAQTGAFQGIFANTSGGVFHPQGMAVGSDGNVYVGGSFPSTVGEYDGQTGALIKMLASPATGWGTPSGLVFNSSGDLLVASLSSDVLTTIDVTTGTVKHQETNPLFSVLRGLVMGPDGYIYGASVENNNIVKINPTTYAATALFPAGSGGLDDPGGLAFAPDGNLLVSSFDSNNIFRYNGSTGVFMNVFAFTSNISQMTALITRSDGSVLALGNGSENVGVFDADGDYSGTLVSPGSGGLQNSFFMISVVPEPTSFLMLGFAGLAMLRCRRP
jgi:WD40 repeat protein